MTKRLLLSAAAANGSGPAQSRPRSTVRQNKLLWSKTGTGTATLNLIDLDSGAALVTAISILAGAQSGVVDFFASDGVQASLTSVSGTVSVNAWLDGWD
ncbi:MAG TPA: hypothetical protein VF957_23475 [Bradyrhizobium sp.]